MRNQKKLKTDHFGFFVLGSARIDGEDDSGDRRMMVLIVGKRKKLERRSDERWAFHQPHGSIC